VPRCCPGWLAGKVTELKCIDSTGASAMILCQNPRVLYQFGISVKELLSHSKFGSSKAFLSGSETVFLAISFSFNGSPFSEDICFSVMRRHRISQESVKAGQ